MCVTSLLQTNSDVFQRTRGREENKTKTKTSYVPSLVPRHKLIIHCICMIPSCPMPQHQWLLNSNLTARPCHCIHSRVMSLDRHASGLYSWQVLQNSIILHYFLIWVCLYKKRQNVVAQTCVLRPIHDVSIAHFFIRAETKRHINTGTERGKGCQGGQGGCSKGNLWFMSCKYIFEPVKYRKLLEV